MVWCLHPFSSMSLDLEGHYRLCCEAMQMPETYLTTTPREIWNSEKMKKIRADMKDGDPYSNPDILHQCQRCIRSEKEAGNSRRLRMFSNDMLRNSFSLQISGFGNKCNLMCNHCSSHLSSKWSHFAKKLREETEYGDLVASDRYADKSNLEFPLTDEEKFNSLIDFINEEVDFLQLSGGEVLLTKKMQDLIQRVNWDVEIAVSTNGSVDTRLYEKFYEWNPNIIYNLSFDGLGDVHELIRTESKWDMYQRNIEWMKSKKIQINGLLALQSLNILQLKEILEYSQVFDHFNYQFVYEPKHLCIRNMHPRAKDQAYQVLDDIQESPIDTQPIYNLLLQPWDEAEWNTLLKWLDMYEKVKNKTLHFERY